jgi:hypothetical protein
MPTQYPMCQVPCVVPALVTAILLASGCSSPGPESQSFSPGASPAAAVAQDEGGLPTKDDGGVGTKDDGGLGTKDDSGLGTKDDSGLGTNDAGTTVDAGSGAADGGISAPPDAGNEVGDCFACAERRGCSVPVNACVQSPACVGEGKCDLACLGSAGPFGALNTRCIESCSKDLHATEALLAAVTCGFKVCPVECLRPLVSCGGDAGPHPLEPSEPGCLHSVLEFHL